MKLLYQGPLYAGSTSQQRFEAFANLPGVNAVPLDSGGRVARQGSLYRRIRWKLQIPVDALDENAALLATVASECPDAVVIDASRVIRASTLRRLRDAGVRCLAYYTPDDIMAPHNLVGRCVGPFPSGNLFFTTKTFNVPELAASGVRRPVLIGNAYDPNLHRPMTRAEVGEQFESFDFVFIGAHEDERCESINRLAEAGLSVVVYGGHISGWRRSALHRDVALGDLQLAEAYARSMHHGKVALCFLRKINRDRITTRTMEIAAMGRPMLAVKTDEHDAHFVDGTEYIGFSTDAELVSKAKTLINDKSRLIALGEAARKRCLSSGYSTLDRGREMIDHIESYCAAKQ